VRIEKEQNRKKPRDGKKKREREKRNDKRGEQLGVKEDRYAYITYCYMISILVLHWIFYVRHHLSKFNRSI
jgi:hypothetical protein